ncbi:MAG: DUF2157 domain-containing protein [Betaproteobacteria bacterium]
MNRLSLYDLAQQHRLDAVGLRRLFSLAGRDDEPDAVGHLLPRIVAVLGAALTGLGLILWIAANWSTLGRFGRFALLEAVIVAMALGAMLRPAARVPLALLAMLGIGGLFAYFGQTYQTGADPWQLFALWAVLALPLCVALRSDVLWTPWALVAMTGVSLWTYAHAAHGWRATPEDWRAHGAGWLAAIAVTALLSPVLARFTGAGAWAMRTAASLGIIMVTSSALAAALGNHGALQYWLGLAVLLLSLALFALPEMFDLYTLSAAALGVNLLIVVGVGHLLFSNLHGGEAIGLLLLLGLLAAGLLAGTVSAILRLARLRAPTGVEA